MKGIHVVLTVAIIAATILIGMEMNREPTLSENIEDAGDQFGDAIEEMGDDVKDATN